MLNIDLDASQGKYCESNGHFMSDFEKVDRIQVLKPDTWNPTPETQNLTPETWHPKPDTRNLQSSTPDYPA